MPSISNVTGVENTDWLTYTIDSGATTIYEFLSTSALTVTWDDASGTFDWEAYGGGASGGDEDASSFGGGGGGAAVWRGEWGGARPGGGAQAVA